MEQGDAVNDGGRTGKELRAERLVESSSTDTMRSSDSGEKRHERESLDVEKSAPVTAPAPDVPPNGGYGWVIVICVFLLNAHSWGLNSTYGVFLAFYIRTGFFPGASQLDYAFVGGFSISCAMLVAPLANTVARKFGTRPSLFVGSCLEAAALIGASFAKQTWQLFLSQGVCFGFGMGFLFSASVGLIPQWFTTRRSLANGIVAAGSGIGGLVYALGAQAMIDNISFEWALRILGILAFSVTFIAILLVRDRNKQVGAIQKVFDFELVKRPEYCLLQAWGFFSMLGYVVLLFSLPNYANSIGLTPHQGSLVGAILNLGQGIGRPPIGYFSDSIGRINMAMLTTFLAGLFSLVIWTNAHNFGVLIFFAIVGGAMAGTYWACIAPVGAEVVGIRKLPAALSMTWLYLVLPTTFSEAIALEIAQHSPIKYLGTELFAGFMYMAAAICLVFLRAWKIGQLETEAAREGHAVDPVAAADAGQNRSASTSLKPNRALFRRMIRLQKV